MKLTTYDKQLLSIVSGLTLSVILVLLLITLSGTSVGNLWMMPVGWFVGAVMVWFYVNKYPGR